MGTLLRLSDLISFARKCGPTVHLLRRPFSGSHLSRSQLSHCDISIPLELEPLRALAQTFNSTPKLAAECRSIRFTPPADENVLDYDEQYDEEENLHRLHAADRALSDQMASIFASCADHGALRSIRWNGAAAHERTLRKPVWDAIARHSGSLQELEVAAATAAQADQVEGEAEEWLSITRPTYPNLRVLLLSFRNAHGWPCEELQNMLTNNCPALEELSVETPWCCGPSGLGLSFTLPRLKSFELRGEELHFTEESKDFFIRHPHIERLTLRTEQPLHPANSDALRALSIAQGVVSNLDAKYDQKLGSFDLKRFGKNIVHLRLMEMPHMSQIMTRGAIHSVARTVRCLELDGEDFRSFEPLLEHLGGALAETTHLEELSIANNDYWPEDPPWTIDHLRQLLTVLSRIPDLPLRALRIFSHSKIGVPLPQDFLDDVGPIPQQLEYIGWEVFEPGPNDVQSTLYRVEERTVRLVEADYIRRASRRMDWTGESILDHLA
uniref:F-box domain-containing protein n=1 Tax=Mycena chlorophos TaxID=658473 RepID=A0ABQ0L179_MYCCL|nr:predicted protein [Mycena chlorophos]